MENMLKDWRFWSFIGTNLVTITGFMIIKYNDFRHLTKDVEKVSDKVDCLDKKVVNLKVDVEVLKEKTKVL